MHQIKFKLGLKFDLMHFNGPQTKFIRVSLYKRPVHGVQIKGDLVEMAITPLKCLRNGKSWGVLENSALKC